MAIPDIIEAAEWLGETVDVAKLERLKELSDNRRFYITMLGHFSAGKSMLINNILGKDILPVQKLEATAVLTYIQYGTLEECVIVYENGTSSNHELSVLKDIFQNTSKFEKIGEIDHIEVYLNNDLLSTGLIMVDTPGVNSVIQKHQDLAVDAIEQSGRIIYVLSNAPSNVDKQFIKQISDCGIHISFIRTYCDSLKNDEEGNLDNSLAIEKNTIEAFLDKKIEFIPISNIKGEKWYDNIIKVRGLIKQMADSISDEMDNNIESRLRLFIANYIQKLCAEVERLEQVKKGDTARMDEEILNYEKDLRVIESAVNDIEKRIEYRVSEAKSQSQKELDKLITSRIDDFSDALDQVKASAVASKEVVDIYIFHRAVTIERIQNLLNTYFDEIIQGEADDLMNSILDKTFSLPVPTYAEVQQDNSRILEMYNSRLLELKQAIETVKEKQSLNEGALNEAEAELNENDYNEALAELDLELAEIPSGMALRLADKQDIQPSSIFKAIGNVVDMALLLLPGDIVYKGIKGIANSTKIAQVLHNMGKVGEVIVKAGNTIGKNAIVIDKVRDTAYVFNQILGKSQCVTKAEKEAAEKIVSETAKKGQEIFEKYKEDKKAGNILDVLSVAYWTEKLGKKFDSGPRMEVDREEEERRNQLRKQIAKQQQHLSDERIKKKKQLGLLQDEAAELKLIEREEEIKKKRIEEEMNNCEKKIIQQARSSALNKYRCEYKNYYGECITSIANDMKAQCFRFASQNITMYIASQSKEVIDAMERKKMQLEEICSLREKGIDEITSKIEKSNEIRKKLEMIS